MKRIIHVLFLTLCLRCYAPADQPCAPDSWIDKELPQLVETYCWLHSNPEVSFQEEQTAARVASFWEKYDYDVTTNVGGHGVVGIMKNGPGKTVMLRCDFDALPVTEQTQLPYASNVRIELPGGGTSGVMHACGHDIHMTNLIAVAKYMSEHRDQWTGTLMLVGQPAEERGAGAKAMLADKLFERFPKPDFAVACHTSADTAAGTIKVLPGFALANVDSVDIKVKGRGGHGSAPHTAVDPIVQAAHLVLALQTIVSREVKPTEPAVVTVGSIHGGTKHNIIPNDCHLQITVRSYDDQVREQVLDSIRKKAEAIAQLFDAPKPDVTVSEGTPSLKNDAELTERLKTVFVAALGSESVLDDEPAMGGEDFSRFGRAGVPILMYRLGTVSQQRLDRFKALDVPPPSLHSSQYYPDAEPSLRTGIKSMSAAALSLLAK